MGLRQRMARKEACLDHLAPVDLRMLIGHCREQMGGVRCAGNRILDHGQVVDLAQLDPQFFPYFAPGGIHNIDELYSVDVGAVIIEDLERKVELKSVYREPLPPRLEGEPAANGTSRVLELRGAEETFTFEDVPERPVPSLLRASELVAADRDNPVLRPPHLQFGADDER